MKRFLNKIFHNNNKSTLEMTANQWGDLFKHDTEEYRKTLQQHITELKKLYS